MRKAHLVAAIAFILLSLTALYLSSELPDSRRGTPGPAAWPIVISCAMLLSGIIFLVKTFTNKNSDALELFNSNNIRVYITMAILVGYFICINSIGFVVSSLVLTFGLFSWYGNFSIIKRVIFSFAIVGIVYGVFNYALNVPFRFGILF
ncbi:tripartite tricarboxylate transporter TctB family protein [Vibrio sp. S12_S33]|uniref:tripartite tricarboxylate transporter TctB family protein n=1 Tax=Vibrio sp. S12_S33 TaxID=2720223 RepID=UPI001783CB49|nr:tripartite tricarboxylate transporter TctB family protein [Vibrio sp. S12_S33]MBD1567409.1 tripartite tricarboxylate transporter TctB family protein [Vibrio sp. S12_S33]